MDSTEWLLLLGASLGLFVWFRNGYFHAWQKRNLVSRLANAAVLTDPQAH